MASARNTQLAPVDENRRYDVETALVYLGISRKLFYEDVAAGRIKTITVGKQGTRTSKKGRVYACAGRRLIPGSEIVRLSSVPTSAPA